MRKRAARVWLVRSLTSSNARARRSGGFCVFVCSQSNMLLLFATVCSARSIICWHNCA